MFFPFFCFVYDETVYGWFSFLCWWSRLQSRRFSCSRMKKLEQVFAKWYLLVFSIECSDTYTFEFFIVLIFVFVLGIPLWDLKHSGCFFGFFVCVSSLPMLYSRATRCAAQKKIGYKKNITDFLLSFYIAAEKKYWN